MIDLRFKIVVGSWSEGGTLKISAMSLLAIWVKHSCAIISFFLLFQVVWRWRTARQNTVEVSEDAFSLTPKCLYSYTILNRMTAKNVLFLIISHLFDGCSKTYTGLFISEVVDIRKMKQNLLLFKFLVLFHFAIFKVLSTAT